MAPVRPLSAKQVPEGLRVPPAIRALLRCPPTQVLGHTYGVTAASVRRLITSGKMVLLDLDKVEQAARLKASGFKVRP